MKKFKILSMIMAVATAFMVGTPVIAADEMPLLIATRQQNDEIKVVLNDEEIQFEDANGKVTPQLINNRTMVPLRKIFEALDSEVEWNSATQTAYATKGDLAVELQIGNTEAKVTKNGETVIETLDSVPVIIDGRTLVPVRFVSESLNLKVGWDQDTKTVILIDPSFILENIKIEAPIFYELITTESKALDTFELDYKIDGSVDYTNKEDKSTNSNVKLGLKGILKNNKERSMIDLAINTSGKGILYEELKESDLNKANVSVILDKIKMEVYTKSSLVEDVYGKNWVKIVGNDANVTESSEENKIGIEEMINIAFDSIEITPETYSTVDYFVGILCKFVNDDYFTVSGRNTKTYTYEIALKDIKAIFKEESLDKILPIDAFTDGKIKMISKYTDGVNVEGSLDISGKIAIGSETLGLSMSSNVQIDDGIKEVRIDLPKENEIIESE